MSLQEGAKLWDHMDIGESMPEEKAAPEAGQKKKTRKKVKKAKAKGKGKKKKKMATPEKEQPAPV